MTTDIATNADQDSDARDGVEEIKREEGGDVSSPDARGNASSATDDEARSTANGDIVVLIVTLTLPKLLSVLLSGPLHGHFLLSASDLWARFLKFPSGILLLSTLLSNLIKTRGMTFMI